MPVKINGASSGSVTLAAPSSGSDVTLTLPTTALATTANVDTAVAPMGLVAVAPTSIANSGGSASLSNYTVSFSGVSSVSLNGVFTGDYDNYQVRLIVAGSDASVSRLLDLRMRAAGADATGSDYEFQSLEAETTSITGARSTSQTGFRLVPVRTTKIFKVIELADPFKAEPTLLESSGPTNTTGIFYTLYSGRHTLSTSYTGFSIFPAAGTITGTVSVYGYKK